MAELKLGAIYPRKEDARRIKLSAILGKDLYVPSEFDAEVNLLGRPFPGRMDCNDRLSCCVISWQAKHSRRMEYVEQGHLINITDDNIEKLYNLESNGEDNGLYVKDAADWWRQKGWEVDGGKASFVKVRGCWHKIKPVPPTPTTKQHLDIFAYAEMDRIEELYRAIYYLNGAGIAVKLYQKDIDQFNAGEPWHLTGNDGDFRGGHMIDVPRFTNDGGLECSTWAKRQPMTPDWYKARVYDTVGIVDNRDNFLANSPVDVEKANALLQQIVNS